MPRSGRANRQATADAAALRAARTLLITTIVTFITVWLVTASSLKHYYTALGNEARYTRARNAECAYKAYEEKNSMLYQLLAFAALKGRFRDNYYMVDGLSERYSPCNFQKSGVIGFQLWTDLSCFGERAVVIEGDADQRAGAMISAIDSCFELDEAREALREPTTLRGLIWAKDHRMWRDIAYWLAMGAWPAPYTYSTGFGGMRARVYEERLVKRRESPWDDRLFDLLVDAEGDPPAVRALLDRNSQEAFEARIQHLNEASPLIGVPGIPTSLGADDLIMSLGLVVAFAYLAFFHLWQHRRSRDLGSTSQTVVGFPSYGSPNDPLHGLWRCRSFFELSGRLIWLVFLVAPIGMQAILFIFRGNLAPLAIDRSAFFEFWPWIAHRGVSYPPTLTSLGIDTINLFSLVVVVISFFQIVKHNRRKKKIYEKGSRMIAIIAGIALGASYVYGLLKVLPSNWKDLSLPWDVSQLWSYSLFLAFGGVWCWVLKRSVHYDIPFAGIIAMIGYVFSIWVFR